ncbi:MAG TPA: aldo/keto reductase [Candidatus Sumerlaeota bacterium]|nr:aldo/keto reductase [Candidatus Sumerlaeota bacterium]
MDRRRFLAALAAAGAVSGLSPSYLQAKEEAEMNPKGLQPVARRPLGRTGEELSIIGFGGIIVMNQTPAESANYVAEAVDRGVNYFDVAPSYGNAQERLGPALKPHRDRCFLACKTGMRDAAGAEKELHESLRLLQTDHFDLYQLHGITDVEKDVNAAFAPGGCMEPILKAREAGKIRFLGFSAHSEEAANAAMDQFDFDTILFPFNFAAWHKGQFGPNIHQRAGERNMGRLALKAMAHQSVGNREKKWDKCWYIPIDETDTAALGLRFTLGLPVVAAIPPGHWQLFDMALRLAQSGALDVPLNDQEQAAVQELARAADPLFSKSAA